MDDGIGEAVRDWADEQAEINRLEAQRQERSEQRIEWDGAEGLMARKQVSRFTAMGEIE